MIQRMTEYQLLTPTKAQDSYGEQVVTYTAAGTVSIFISFLTGDSGIQNNVKTVNASHMGITASKQLKEGDKLTQSGKTYFVTYANNAPRLSVIYLKEVAEYGG